MRKAHAHRRVRPVRAAVLAAACAAPVMFGFGPASAQGLFEALFGGGGFRPAPPTLYGPPANPFPEFGYDNRRAGPKRMGREHRRPISREASKPGPYVAPEVLPGPLGRFLRDPSLRKGDIVATADGLMVFRGARGSRHSVRDFVPVSQARSLVAGSARTELAKLDGAVRTRRDSSTSIIAETAPPIVAQDEGRRVR